MPLLLQDVRYPHRVEVALQAAPVVLGDGTLSPQPTPDSVSALASDVIVLEFFPCTTLWGVKLLASNFDIIGAPLPVVGSSNLWSTYQARIIDRLGRDYRLIVTGTALATIELARQVNIEFVFVPTSILTALQL